MMIKQLLSVLICLLGVHNIVFSQSKQDRQIIEEDARRTYDELKDIDVSDFKEDYDFGGIDIDKAKEVNEEDLGKYLEQYANHENSRNLKELMSANDKSKLWLQTLDKESHNSIVERFKDTEISNEELSQMNDSYELFRGNPTKENYQNYVQMVSDYAKKHDSWCDLTVQTIPRDGATIKYKLLEEKQTFTMGASQASKRLKIGYYSIWSERKGKVTSNKNDICECIQEVESYTIEEK